MDVSLRVDGLTVRAGATEIVHGIGFSLARGQRTGLIGESGSGKTLTALAIMGLLPDGLSASGRVDYDGQNLLNLTENALCALRGDRLAMIFQEPMTALNPVQRIGDQVAEPFRIHRRLGRSDALRHAREMLDKVHIPDPDAKMRSYPHQLSGGQRQRAMIAMAAALRPDVLLADEPTTALDVTVQAQILALLSDLVREEQSSLLLITHDLPVVATVCQNVLVLYGGYIVEEGAVEVVFEQPGHPYTRALLDAIPPLDEDMPSRILKAISGSVPAVGEFPPGCPFRNRCPRVTDVCAEMPPLTGSDHRFACWHPLET